MFLKFKVKQILIISILCGLTESSVNADKWGKRGYGQSPPGFQLINQGILPYYMPFRHQGSKGQTLAEDGCDEGYSNGKAGEEMAESDPSNVGSEQEVGQQPNANRFGLGFGFLKNEKKGKHGHGKHKKAKKTGNISKTTGNIMSWFKLLPKLIPALKAMLQMVCGVTPNPLEGVVNPKVMDAINSVCSIVGILSLGGAASTNVPEPTSKRHLGKKGQQHTSSKNPGRPSRDGPDIILDMIHMVQLLLSGPCRELHYVTDKSYPNSAKELCSVAKQFKWKHVSRHSIMLKQVPY